MVYCFVMTSYEMTTHIETMETIYSRIISVIVTGLKTIICRQIISEADRLYSEIT